MNARENIMNALLAQLTGAFVQTTTGTLTSGQATVTGIPTTTGIYPGLPISGIGIGDAVLIQSVDSATQITLTAPATASGTAVALSTGLQTTGRRLQPWNQVAAQPALFLRNEGEEHAERRSGMPPKVTIKAEAWVYSNAGRNPDFAPSAGLNSLLDAIEAALKPTTYVNGAALQTLGGLVAHAWIEGEVMLHPGDLDGQAIAVVPIKILVPALN